MHGRLKVRSSAERAEAERKEKALKLANYRKATCRIFEKRRDAELDNELLEITAEILLQNSDFATMWNIRREVLFEKKKLEEEVVLKNEFYLVEQCLRGNPKSYGAWHHRLWVMKTFEDVDWAQELKLCNKFLEYDSRNFHCWDYRRFVVEHSHVSDADEFKYTHEKILENFSNFSAWHYRTKLLPRVHPGDEGCTVEEEVLVKELDMVQNAYFTDPYDQSAWFYHRWLLAQKKVPLFVQSCCIRAEDGLCFVVFSQQRSSFGGHFVVNGEKLDLNFTPHVEDSRIWLATFNDVPKLFEVLFTADDVTIRCSIDEDGANHRCLPRFSSDWTGASESFLTQELENCEQLYDLEPQNKWVLLTVILLMRAINLQSYARKSVDLMDELVELDPARTQYYMDLKSRYVIENHLMDHLDAKKIDLSNKGLTSLHHTSYMTLAKHIDLRNNPLRNRSNLHFLLCLVNLED